MVHKIQIRHIDEVRELKAIPDGWYQIPPETGVAYTYYENGKRKTTVAVSESDYMNYEAWAGDDITGDSETISWHKNIIRAEQGVLDFIKKHPKGW